MKPGRIEPRRLARAVRLRAVRVDDTFYAVAGGAKPHVVNVTTKTCDCDDHLYHGDATWCKHVLAALLRRGHGAVIAALRDIVPHPDRPQPSPLSPHATESAPPVVVDVPDASLDDADSWLRDADTAQDPAAVEAR